MRGCEIRYDRINAELSSTRERYWRAKQESQEKRDDMNRMIYLVSLVFSLLVLEQSRVYFNRRAIRLENEKMMEDTKMYIARVVDSFKTSNEGGLKRLEVIMKNTAVPKVVENSTQTETSVSLSKESTSYSEQIQSLIGIEKEYADIYLCGAIVGVGLAVITLFTLGLHKR